MHESEKWRWSHSVVSDSSQPHGLQPTRLLHPWDFPGKSTGVGCHCLLRLHCIRLNKWNTVSHTADTKQFLEWINEYNHSYYNSFVGIYNTQELIKDPEKYCCKRNLLTFSFNLVFFFLSFQKVCKIATSYYKSPLKMTKETNVGFFVVVPLLMLLYTILFWKINQESLQKHILSNMNSCSRVMLTDQNFKCQGLFSCL